MFYREPRARLVQTNRVVPPLRKRNAVHAPVFTTPQMHREGSILVRPSRNVVHAVDVEVVLLKIAVQTVAAAINAAEEGGKVKLQEQTGNALNKRCNNLNALAIGEHSGSVWTGNS
jgi:hypothetical protein